MKKKKNNPKLAVNIVQEIEKEIMHQGCFIPNVNLSCKRDSLTNFRAEKARENLRREKGAEEIRRVVGEKGMVPFSRFCFGM